MSTLTTILAIAGLGATEITLIVLVLIFFFGAKKIPEIARGLGKSMSEFRKGQSETGTDSTTPPNDTAVPPGKRYDEGGNLV